MRPGRGSRGHRTDVVIGHCDVAPRNIVARNGLPVALIDWETAGPVDPLTVEHMIEQAVSDIASEADDANVTPDTTSHPAVLWGMAWRARSATWMIRHRHVLDAALKRGN